ncbi:MAG TPA: glutaredoxin 3 [Polyangiaceae bacterium]|nr:glutaredoxin 3 [Polyangiaceae bacterium]
MSFAAKVVVYVTDYCPYCTRAKALLDKKGVPYDTVDVTGDDAKRAWLVRATGRRTVPQIFINDRAVGGCDDLYALDRGGKLDPMLREATPA